MPGTMEIQIHTFDEHLLESLFGQAEIGEGQSIEIAEGIAMTYERSVIRRGFGSPEVITLALSFPVGVSASFIAAWIYDKLKGTKVERIFVDRTEVQFDEGSIKKVIEEKIEIQQH